MPSPRRDRQIEWAFRLSLLGKAALAILQITGGLFLLVMPGDTIRATAAALTGSELVRDPTDRIARAIMHWATTLNPAGEHFYIVYLLGHGAIHVIVVTALLMKSRIAYPFSLATLMAFVAYQTWEWLHTFDPALLVLTAIDVCVITIVILEHRLTRRP
ncbi:Uncharacterized membrane protein [Loktanella atrilutea]|uniref:Uncharacterized membrane protein n=1 Tax=Loktanella atrilutea TaxID=366533 RepID=A0A1M4TAW3_LOKAT|nr:DUF2127 domain-containing protein [Loktanella atrilutea]SHE41560.1 Uncharacterized membrane protein [Loktanella atrilutea]